MINKDKDNGVAVVVDRLSLYRDKLIERKKLIQNTLDTTPKKSDFHGEGDLAKFLEYYFVNETRRLSDTLTSTMPMKKELVETLQDKQLAIRHLKLFIENIGTMTDEMLEEIKNIDKTLQAIDVGGFDESLLDSLDLGV